MPRVCRVSDKFNVENNSFGIKIETNTISSHSGLYFFWSSKYEKMNPKLKPERLDVSTAISKPRKYIIIETSCNEWQTSVPKLNANCRVVAYSYRMIVERSFADLRSAHHSCRGQCQTISSVYDHCLYISRETWWAGDNGHYGPSLKARGHPGLAID